MACENFEHLIPDFLENQLAPAERTRVAAHLAACAECRAFAGQLEQLDTQLARTLKTPTLSPAFNARLRERLQATTVLTEPERAARRRAMQADYQAGLARLTLLPALPRKLLEGFGVAAMLSVAGWIAWTLMPQFALASSSMGVSVENQHLLLLLASGAIPIGLGLLVAFPRRTRASWPLLRAAGAGGFSAP